jgi:hypothetical protein
MIPRPLNLVLVGEPNSAAAVPGITALGVLGKPVSPGTRIGVELAELPTLPTELDWARLLMDEAIALDRLELMTEDFELDNWDDDIDELEIPADDAMEERLLRAPVDCALLEMLAAKLDTAKDDIEGVGVLVLLDPPLPPQAASVRLKRETKNKCGKGFGLISFLVIRLFPAESKFSQARPRFAAVSK